MLRACTLLHLRVDDELVVAVRLHIPHHVLDWFNEEKAREQELMTLIHEHIGRIISEAQKADLGSLSALHPTSQQVFRSLWAPQLLNAAVTALCRWSKAHAPSLRIASERRSQGE